MKLGIGIDTGGTCTDAVVYQFENKEILATAKTPTTHDELSIGIGNALDGIPREYLDQAEVIALSTTLATNACVENKGGRAKLIFFGVTRGNVERVGKECGLEVNDNIIFIDCKTLPNGEIQEEPDWDYFEENLHAWLDETDAVGVVEMYARKSGAGYEKKAAQLIKEAIGIPVVCGYNLFSEYNIVKRGASALLNARLLSVIDRFLNAVKSALKERNITAPFVIVRSDGSLMTGDFTSTRPVETLLCGPVASVMGAMELSHESNAMVVDIGGTTTDVAFVKDGRPQRVKTGVRIGKWDTFVKGLSVDTFGLGGDSGVLVDSQTDELYLEDGKVMPLCMAAEQYPSIMRILQREDEGKVRINTELKHIYVALHDISDKDHYNSREKQAAAALYNNPLSLELLRDKTGEYFLEYQLDRLIREGVIIRCGVTPTDAMHLKGDFTAYNREASVLGLRIMGRILQVDEETLAEMVYEIFRRKLYCSLVRIFIEDAYPEIRKPGMKEQLEQLVRDAYEQTKVDGATEFLQARFTTPCTLIGVGAPTSLFLPDVGKLLNAKVVSNQYSPVANALGAVVGKVQTGVTMEVRYNYEADTYTVFGMGERVVCETLNPAKDLARGFARSYAEREAIAMGADPDTLEYKSEEEENIIETEFGPLYMGFKVNTVVSGNLRLNE